MVKELKLAYEFDFVFDGQKVFRELLHVLANPGTIGSIRTRLVNLQAATRL